MRHQVFFLTIVFFLATFNVRGQNSSGSLADTVLADQFLNEMRSLIQESKWTEAEVKGEQARAIYESLLGEECRQMGDVWHHMGKIYSAQGDFDRAMEYFHKAFDIRFKTLGENHPDVAHSLNNMGICYYYKGDYTKAIEYTQKALKIYLITLDENHPDVVRCFHSLGFYYSYKGEYDKAIECFEKALRISLNTLGENHADVAMYFNNLGVNFNSKGEYDKAIDYYQKALKIGISINGEVNADVSASFNNLGNSFNSKGEYDKAIEYHQKSLKIKLKIQGKKHPDVAAAFNNLGLSFNNKGEYDKAIDYHRRALEIRLNAFGENHPDVAMSFNNLGVSFNSKGDFDRAILYYQKAAQIWLNTYDENYSSVAKSFNNLGVCFEGKGEYEKAIEYHQKALKIRLNVFGENHPEVAVSFINLGNIFSSKGEYDQAIQYYKKTLKILTNTYGENHSDVAKSFNNLGWSFNYKGEYDTAIIYCQKALKIRLATLGKAHPNVIASCLALINVYDKTHQYDSVFYYIEQAVASIRVQAVAPISVSTKGLYQSQNLPVFEQAIDISLKNANLHYDSTLKQKVFNYSEMSKATMLQAQINAADALAFAGIPDSLLRQERNLRIDITWREKQRQGLFEQGLAETDTTVLRISSLIFDLKDRYEALKKRFEADFPEYYRLQYDLSTVSLSYVQDTLLEKGQTLVEYFTGDSAIYVFTIRPDTFTVTEIKKDFSLDTLVRQLREGIYSYYQRGVPSAEFYNTTAHEYTKSAYTLYDKLIKPIASLLTENVIVVPDGVLGYVPFDALLTEKPVNPTYFHSHAYLGRERRISYAYSATLLREMRDKVRKSTPTGSVLALAPFFRGDATVLREQLDTLSELVALRADTLKPLQYSGREVLIAEKILKGQALLGLAATKDTFQYLAGRYRILHLSTHGKANDRIGDYAYLGFARSDTSFEKMYVKDIYNLSLNADMVVLSACETGIGQLQRGEGIISLARAFAYAGAKSIVTTLWQVDDARTSRLMQHFYKNLQQGMTKGEALWHAKRTLFAGKKDNAHPFFWAGFIPVGDMRALHE